LHSLNFAFTTDETQMIKERDAEPVVTVEMFDLRDELYDLIVGRGRSTRTEHCARDLGV